jgi:hypothetical protein
MLDNVPSPMSQKSGKSEFSKKNKQRAMTNNLPRVTEKEDEDDDVMTVDGFQIGGNRKKNDVEELHNKFNDSDDDYTEQNFNPGKPLALSL